MSTDQIKPKVRSANLKRERPGKRNPDVITGRISQLFRAQSLINDAAARATDFRALCELVCRIGVEQGGIACVLVRLLDVATGMLMPVAFHGPHTGLVGRHELPAHDGKGVSAIAFQTAKRVVVDDMRASPITTHAAGEIAAQFNINSGAAFPLLSGGKPVGSFAMFAVGNGFFDADMAALLDTTAAILGFSHERLAAESARAEIERRNRELVERSPTAIRIIQDGRIVMINRAGLDQLGYASFDEISEIALAEFIHPDQRILLDTQMAEMLGGANDGYTQEYLNRHRDGHYYPVEVCARPFTFAGRPAVIGYVQDLTERRRAEQAVRDSEQRLRLALSASQSGVWDWDLKTGKALLSDEYYRMFGYEPGEFEGNIDTLLRMVHPKNRDQTRASLEQQWRSGVAATDYEQRFVCKDGSIKWVRVRATILRDAEGRAERMVGTSIDLTERKKRERHILQLSRLNATLGKINAAVARVTRFDALAADACRFAVEDGGFVSAVIRMVDTDMEQLTQIADFGLRDGFLGLDSIKLSVNRGVTTQAFHQRQPVIVRDLATDPLTHHAAEDGKRLGITSGASFPLMVHGAPIGTLTVWGRNAAFVDEQNLNLLQQMVDAVAFAHAKLEADAALIARERDMTLAQQAGNIGSMVFDTQSEKWATSSVGFAVLGLPAAAWYPLSVFEGMLPPETRESTMATMRANIAAGHPTSADYPFIRASDGARRWLRVVADTDFDSTGKGVRRVGTLQDVTTEHLARQAIERSNRLYDALRKTSDAVVHATDFAMLGANACRIAVEDGGLGTAIIRQYNPDTHTLDRLAHFGPTIGRLGVDSLSVDDPGLTLDAFRLGHVVLLDSHDPHATPLSADASKLGLTAAASYPLSHDGHAFGTFTVFAADVRAFDEATTGLLQKIADAISFGHEKLLADASLRSSRHDLELAQEAGRIGSAILNLKDATWHTSRVGCEILGLAYAPAYPLSDVLDLLTPASRAFALAYLREHGQSTETRENTYEMIHPHDHQSRWIRVTLAGETGPDGSVARRIGTIQDVTHQHLNQRRANLLARLYVALSETNKAIVRAADFAALCRAVCQIVVERGGLVSAAIRLLDVDRKLLVETATYGPRAGLLARADIPVDDTRGVAINAFRSRAAFVVPKLADDPRTVESSAAAAEIGITSAAAFPLFAQGEVFGVFSVWASDSAWLDDQISTLLTEIAEAVSFARAKLAADTRLEATQHEMLLAQRYGRVGSMTHDQRTDLWTVSEVGAEILGVATTGPHDIAQWKALFPPDLVEPAYTSLRAHIEAGQATDTLYHIRRPSDGQARWVRARVNSERADDGTPLRRVGTIQDVTDETISRDRIERLTRLYATLSKTNEAVVRSDNYDALAASICRIVVEEGRLVSAVIRLYHPETQTLVEVASHGPRTGTLGRPVVPVGDPQGLAVQAFRHGRRIIVSNLEEHPSTRDSHNDAHANGIVAGAAFPLRGNGGPIGTMTLFADHVDAFNDQMADLIGEIADSAAFAHAKFASDHARRDADARMAAIVDSAMDAIITCDDALRIVVFNDAAQRIFRIAEADAIGQSLDMLLPQRYRAEHPRSMQSFGNHAAGSRSMGRLAQVTALRSDGNEFPVEASISHTEVSGRIFYTVIMRDVTAKLANLRALSETERRYRSLVETSLNSVMLLDNDTITYANPASARILGFDSTADMVGTSVYTHTMPAHLEEVRAQITRMMQRAGETLDRQLLKLHRRRGEPIETYATANSIDIEGRILIQLELRDVTRERRALAEVKSLAETLDARVVERTGELSLANAALAGANRDLESFSYSVAHDLRAPLRSIGGFAGLLRQDLESGTLDEALAYALRITDSALRMNELIDGLLAVARVTHGKLADAPVDFDAMVRAIVFEATPGDTVDLGISPLPTMRGDAASLRQVWTNLISNALKYSAKRATPKVDIGVTPGDTEFVFYVRDNGAGFEPAHAGKLFGVFQRLHTADEFEGTGVGLAGVRRIVERHGGRTWAEGTPGVGATFYFSLPAELVVEAAGS